MTKCKTCLGVYAETLPDGTRYFHSCPPVSTVRVKRSGAWTNVPLTDMKQTDTLKVRRGTDVIEALVSELEKDDQRLDDAHLEHAEKRDENIKITGYTKDGTPIAAPKSEGKGKEAA